MEAANTIRFGFRASVLPSLDWEWKVATKIVGDSHTTAMAIHCPMHD